MGLIIKIVFGGFKQKQWLDFKRKGSEWFWEVDEKNIPFNKKPLVEPWKCPYHNGRMCFEMIRRLRNAS